MKPEQFGRITKALADPRRFELLERIAAKKECACSTLAAELPVTAATISHHLKELSDAGLVTVRREAKFAYYQAETDTLSEYLRELSRRLKVKN